MKYSFFWILLLGFYPSLLQSSISSPKFVLKSPLKPNILLKSLPSTQIPIVTSSLGNEIQKQPLYTKFFPVYPKELSKFFRLSSMMFWAIFVFTLSRDTKDTLIVTSCGAEAIAFLKVYGVIPAATIFMILYSKLSSILSPQVAVCHQPSAL
jgi:hypothetical protein